MKKPTALFLAVLFFLTACNNGADGEVQSGEFTSAVSTEKTEMILKTTTSINTETAEIETEGNTEAAEAYASADFDSMPEIPAFENSKAEELFNL